jgi:arylsulfatase A-like enzyme
MTAHRKQIPAGRIFLLAFALATALSLLSGPATANAAGARRPNIVLILADDMGFSDLGCYGSEIATPNLDRLAAGGLRFTQFYNCARCCPTRASLMTGLYPHQAGVGHMVEHGGIPIHDTRFPAYRGDLSKQAVTIAQVLQAAGYHTAMSGKWHVTPMTEAKHNWPLQRSFEKYFGLIHGASSYFDPTGILVRDNQVIKPEGADFYITDAIAENAIRYLADFGREQKPFFLYVAFTAPHWPLHARPEDIAKYRGHYTNNWAELRQARYQKQISMGLINPQWPISPRDMTNAPLSAPQYAEWQDARMAAYAAQIDRLDQNVGEIIARLSSIGALENTLVFFLSDNGGCAENLGPGTSGPYVPANSPTGGPMRKGNSPEIFPGPADTYSSYGQAWANVSNTPFRYYKHWVHEGGISTPLIAYWPAKIKPARVTHQLGHLVDLMATCLDVAGAKYPRQFNGEKIIPLEGKSLLPVLQGKQRKGHQTIFWEHEGNRAVRQGKWKLVGRYANDWELYDMDADRTELNNLAAKNPAKVAELTKLYEQWAARVRVEPWEKVKDLR